jgi:hypothetical protein
MIDSHRISSARGYLEIIRQDGRDVAYVTDIYGPYVGVYGVHEVVGRTVADVKTELFGLIESGQ